MTRLRNHNLKSLRKLLIVLFSLILFNVYNLVTVQAESNINNPSESEFIEESDDFLADNDNQNNIGQIGQSVPFRDYVPYANFINYQYQGDQTYFDVRDMIMEYAPDSNGTFQVTAFSGQETIAYIYQIRESGLYELASFNDYYVVEDLRYSQDATDGVESLVLPANLTVGTTFRSGYNNELQYSVAELIDSYPLGGQSFSNVVRITQEVQDESGQVTYNYYYAPIYGLLVIERTDASGVTQRVLQLVSTQGQMN